MKPALAPASTAAIAHEVKEDWRVDITSVSKVAMKSAYPQSSPSGTIALAASSQSRSPSERAMKP